MLPAALGLLVGLVIGTLGGGGGVLSLPALVYVLGQDAHTATTGSIIIIVGVVSAVGVLARIRQRTIDWRIGVAFGLVGIPASAAGSLLNRTVSQPVLLLVFAALTLTVAVIMLVNSGPAQLDPPDGERNEPARRRVRHTAVRSTGPPGGTSTHRTRGTGTGLRWARRVPDRLPRS